MKKFTKTEVSKLITNKATRRDFLRYTAAAGTLIPMANMFLGHRAYAQGSIKRVIFFYYPNGMVKEQWQPNQGNGTISNGSSLSFSLDPLKNHHDKVIVCKNIRLAGIPTGGHVEPAQNILATKGGLGNDEATVDQVLGNRLTPNGRVKVANVGVRTGRDGQYMVSKPYGVGNTERPVPNNDPKAASDYLFANLNNDNNTGGSQLRQDVLDAVLADINQLKGLNLQGVSADKVEENERALQQVQNSIEQVIGNCNLEMSRTQVTDPWSNEGSTADNYGHWQHIPAVAHAQIENAVGALACGVSNVATVQMMRGDENVSLANYSFDGCWNHIEEAYRVMGGTPVTRWYNEHSSHTASHQVFPSHAGQARWYVEQFAHLLDRLENYGILNDTLAVMISEVGDGNDHGDMNGGVIVGGGGNALNLGRVVDCNNSLWTSQLFSDIGSLVGQDLSGLYGGGGVIS